MQFGQPRASCHSNLNPTRPQQAAKLPITVQTHHLFSPIAQSTSPRHCCKQKSRFFSSFRLIRHENVDRIV